MYRLLYVASLSYVLLVLFVLVDFSRSDNPSPVKQRPRRFLRFSNISHLFLRLNIKANMVPWNQFFAQGLGFRMNWDGPPDSFHPYHRIYRRSAYKHLETLLDSTGVSGLQCIRRAICELDMITEPASVYHKILKIFFRRRSSLTDRWQDMTSEDCAMSVHVCPFSMLEVSTFTDL